jgi:hypothetical protein
MTYRKDRSLDELAQVGNVAQFVSFAPVNGKPVQQFCRIAGFKPNHFFQNEREAIEALLSASPERTINIRSFEPESPRSREFHYGIADHEQALALTDRLSTEGMYVTTPSM